MKKIKIAAAVLLLSAATTSGASVSSSLFSPEAGGYIERGRLMLENGNTAGAIDQLKYALGADVAFTLRTEEECRYLIAMAYYERGDEQCMDMLAYFADTYPQSSLAAEALMARANHLFFTHRYGQASVAYKKVDGRLLSKEDAEILNLRHAVSLIRIGEYKQGISLLEPIASRESDTGEAARYYEAYAQYCLRNINVARNKFQSLDRVRLSRSAIKGRLFSPDYVDPDCYLAQIDYAEGLYADGAARALSAMKGSISDDMKVEMQRIAGECLFREGRYEEALPLLEKYYAAPDIEKATSAVYAYGTILYDRHDYRKSAEILRKVAGNTDAVAQGAALTLGQCEEVLGNYQQALSAYTLASDRNYDSKVAETALYNIIALSMRSKKPDIKAMSDFIRLYPNSNYTPEVIKGLAAIEYEKGNYTTALINIERISSPDAEARNIKVKILYRLGVDAFKRGKNTEAESYLQRAISANAADKSLVAQCHLWLGEALYTQKKYASAEKQYRIFTTAIPKGENAAIGVYDLASALYMQKKFKEARPLYERVANMLKGTNSKLRSDALTRAADCANYTGDVASATASYSAVIEEKEDNSGYALLQRAKMYGLQGDLKRKLSELETILNNAEVGVQAMLEKGRTLVEMNRSDEAAEVYKLTAERYPDAAEAREALLQRAIILSGQHKDNEAQKAYEEIISRWPSSAEALVARQDLGTVKNRIEETTRPMRTFEQAELLISGSQAEEGIVLLEELAKDPDSEYGARAYVRIAEYRLSKGQTREAQRLMEQFTDRGSEQQYWLARGFITLADALTAQGNKSLAAEYLRSLKSNYTNSDDDITDMINQRLKKLK